MAHPANLSGDSRGTAKAAEVASGLGAAILGAGLALLAAAWLRPLALPLLFAGVLVHGVGMLLKTRLEGAARAPLWWERTLSWLCWVCLGALLAWALLLLVPG